MPTLGMNIQDLLYNFTDEISLNGLKTKLVNQCSAFYDSVRDESFDIRWVTQDSQRYLLFLIPVITVSKKNVLTIGITKSENGRAITYNYVFTESSYY
jgi:hypothetical protein